MPESLREFLIRLYPKEAEDVWKYLDSTPHVASKMIEVILDGHPHMCSAERNAEREKAAK